MGPGGGIQVGWSEVLPVWEAQAAMKLGGEVDAADIQVSVGRDLAIVTNYEKGENKGPDGKTETVSIRATSTFRKEKSEWKMIGHHTDLLPYLKQIRGARAGRPPVWREAKCADRKGGSLMGREIEPGMWKIMVCILSVRTTGTESRKLPRFFVHGRV